MKMPEHLFIRVLMLSLATAAALGVAGFAWLNA